MTHQDFVLELIEENKRLIAKVAPLERKVASLRGVNTYLLLATNAKDEDEKQEMLAKAHSYMTVGVE